jgi:hypothetical protein
VDQTVCFDALGFVSRIWADDARLTDYLAALFADLATSARDGHRYVFCTTPAEYGEARCDVSFDGCHLFNAPVPEQLVASLVRDINHRAIESCELLALHAGGVEHDDVGLVFPGRMEAGKTTLVTGLVRAGMNYLTDEAVAIDRETLLICPYPKPLSLDPGSWALFPELEPEARLSSDDYKLDQWQVPSSAIRAGAVGRPCPVRVVIFPRYEPGAPTVMEPLRRAEALIRLTENTFHFETQRRTALDLLAEVVRLADCYHLTVGDLDEAVVLVSSVGAPAFGRRAS